VTADRLIHALGLHAPYAPSEPVVFVAYVDELDENGERLSEDECGCASDDDCDCPASIHDAVVRYVESRS
jgi:hypothetical protein